MTNTLCTVEVNWNLSFYYFLPWEKINTENTRIIKMIWFRKWV